MCKHFMQAILGMMLLAHAAMAGQHKTDFSNQAFSMGPSYFVGNTTSTKTGKRLIEDDAVLAFLQTVRGRVLFSSGGAYIGMPTTSRRDVDDPGKTELRGHDTRANQGTVVLKAGFNRERSKRGFALPRLEEPVACKMSFFIGARDTWRTDVPAYRKLVYAEVWDGIDLEFLGTMDGLEYRLLLAPGSDPNNIVMETGGQTLRITPQGGLIASLAGAELHLGAPRAFQFVEGTQREVGVRYLTFSDGRFGFALGSYDPRRPLVIDPDLTWSSYLGGAGGDDYELAEAIAIDGAGNSFVTGLTGSADFPTTTGCFDQSWNGAEDAFVTKMNSSGSGLVYSLYLGGSDTDRGKGIAVMSSGEAFVTGYTWSNDFPTTSGAYSETLNGYTDVFVARINSSGTGLMYATYLGGSFSQRGHAIAVDDNANVYVTGYTQSHDFPTTPGAYDETADDFEDVFVTKLDKNGANLVYSTYLGEDGHERGDAIAVDDSGNAYVTGRTDSDDFPTTLGAFDPTINGASDAFVTKLNSGGTALSYSTFVGGSSSDYAYGISVDDSGNAYVTGETGSADFPADPSSFDPTFNGGAADAFVIKVNSSGSGLAYATFLGGHTVDRSYAIAVDDSGHAFVTGRTISNDFPTTPGAFDRDYAYADVFVTKLSTSGKTLVYSTFLGEMETEYAYGIAVDATGNAYVTGQTYSPDFPTNPGAFSRSLNGAVDAFITKVNSTGTGLVFSSFLGGSGDDEGLGIAVDRFGSATVVGETGSSSFPTTPGAYAETFGGAQDAFVVKVDPDCRDLAYATFLGGSDGDTAYAIALDDSGNAYVTGSTESTDFPTTPGAFDETLSDYIDAFVAKIDSSGTNLVYSTLLGGSSFNRGKAIVVNGSGHASVTGYTNSDAFPTTPGAFDVTFHGQFDVFVTQLNGDGSDLVYSTFLGGSSLDEGQGIALDPTDRVIVTGFTQSTAFPTTPGAYDASHNGNRDAFVTCLNEAGTALVYSTFVGGAYDDSSQCVAVDGSGNALIVGDTGSSDFPTTAGAVDESFNGGTDVFVTRLSSDGSALSFSTFLGGSSGDHACGVALDHLHRILVTGVTYSSDFPTTSGSFDETYNDRSDAFIGRISADGSALSYASFLGGERDDRGSGIAVDSSGNAYVTGRTRSADFPTTAGAYEETQSGYGDVFISKFFALPLQPIEIAGPDWVCQNDTGIVYSIDPVAGATTYTWSVPSGASIVSGQGTTGITVDFGIVSGDVSVTANNLNGSSAPQTLSVAVYGTPPQPGVIAGSETVCEYATGVSYSIAPVSGATHYTWTASSGAGITSGQGTTAVTVDFTAASSIISVTAENPCATGPAQSTVVVVIAIPDQPGPISGPGDVCEFETDVAYSIASVAGATGYTWSVPGGAAIVSGQGTTHVTIEFGATSGNVSVSANNSCGTSPAQSAPVTVHVPVAIAQDPNHTTVCPGGSAGFTVTATGTGPLDYLWNKDGMPLSDGGQIFGSATHTLSIDPVSVDDEGAYDCSVTNLCGALTSDSATLTADGPLDVALIPRVHNQGIDPISFVAQTFCVRPEITYAFSTSPATGFSTSSNTITIGVTPPPQETTLIDVIVTDDVSREVQTASAVLLVSQNPVYFDLDADLCNTLRDLWLLCEHWRSYVADDPNGDGFIDIRDFLYINLDDPLSCGSE